MPQDVELILLKQLASCLRTPIALLAPDGAVRFYNEPAELLFGVRFEEVGPLEADRWEALLAPSSLEGAPLAPGDRPLFDAVTQRVPGHRRLRVRAGESWAEIEVTGIPLLALGERFLGALGLFWRAGAPLPPVRGAGHRAGDPHAVELILARRLASTLIAPIFLVDAAGGLLYFNPAAELILGRPFAQAQQVESRRELYDAFRPRDARGRPIDARDHPLSVARRQREPVHEINRIRDLEGNDREIAITAVPLVGQSDELLGAFGIFWESDA